jgi:pilus assembly protein CpaB
MKRTTRAQMLVATGAVLAIALIVYGAWRITASDHKPATPVATTSAQAGATQTVVAARPIYRGQTIVAADLGVLAVTGEAPAGAIKAIDGAVGKTAAVDIPQNQLVLASSLTGGAGGAGLAPLVPAGMRAISMDVTTEIAVANFVKPGDHVDVEIFLPKSVVNPQSQGADASEASGLLRNVLVLAVGPQTTAEPTEEDKKKSPEDQAAARDNRTITVAMTPEQVSKFVLARGLGRFYLTLRNPTDMDPGPASRAQLASIRGGAMARPVGAGGPVRRAAAAPRQPIEVVVEGRREVIYPGAGK